MAARPPGADGKPVHAFKPTSGTFLGVVGVGVAVLVVVLVLAGERSVVGIRTALVAALVGVLLWMVLLRPRVKAYADTLLLRNIAGDVHVPLAAIDDVGVRHTLRVSVGEKRYSCPGIGRSTRSMVRAQRGGTTSADDYVTFVETTIEELARSARRDSRSEPPPVRRTWAVPELAAVGVLVAALAATFVV